MELNYKNFSSIEDFSRFWGVAGFVFLNHPTPPSNGMFKGPPSVKYVSADFFHGLTFVIAFL